MASRGQADRELPFQTIFPYLLRSILFALGEVSAMDGPGAVRLEHGRINRHFSWLAKAFRHGENRHFYDGGGRLEPLRTEALRPDSIRKAPIEVTDLLNNWQSLEQDRHEPFIQSGPTRISCLIIENFFSANPRRRSGDSEIDRPEATGYLLPSPLKIAVEFLADPDLPETYELAFYTARAFLFQVCQTCPVGYRAPATYKTFGVGDVKDEISRINTSLRPRHDSRGADPINGVGRTGIGTILRHLLAIDGSFNLRFDSIEALSRYCTDISGLSDIIPSRKASFQFARAQRLRRLPSEGFLVNRLFGIPIPLRGAATIFAGGLRLNSEHGLVVAVHGDAGAGKTSLALALATSLAPLGFQTLFLTAEETELDLQSKIQSLRPADIERISAVKGSGGNIKFINLSEPGSDDDEDLTIMDRAISILTKNVAFANEVDDDANAEEIISPTKSIIILDGVHDILVSDSAPENYDMLRAVVDTCRKQRSLVILTTGTEWANSQGIDYLVDMSISVSNEPFSEYSPRPRREMVVTKARHQLCSVGAHGFNIGGDRGFRFTPQASYLLDTLSINEPYLPDQSVKKLFFARQYVFTGSEVKTDGDQASMQSDNKFELYHRSNIFINGRGSAGKAALALRAAMTPYAKDGHERSLAVTRSRMLIISFLYGSEYYQSIFRRLRSLITRENRGMTRGYHRAPDVLQLYPGYITSDELLFKVKSLMDAEVLRGEPYTEVIFDGIHNVFLQFPELEENVVFWPQMFSLLRHYDASMITTNTILVVDDPDAPSGELTVDNRKSEPLRQALVYKTDFYLELNRVNKKQAHRAEFDEFAVRVRSALAQRVPVESVSWNREAMVFVNGDQGKLGV